MKIKVTRSQYKESIIFFWLSFIASLLSLAFCIGYGYILLTDFSFIVLAVFVIFLILFVYSVFTSAKSLTNKDKFLEEILEVNDCKIISEV